MLPSLNRRQALYLGLVVCLVLALAAAALYRIGLSDSLWAEKFDVYAKFDEVHDVMVGTPVRIRGVPVGQVVDITYLDEGLDTEPKILLRLRLDKKFEHRLYNDATATLHATGILGTKVVAISPGTASAGILNSPEIRTVSEADLATAAAKFTAVAEEAERLIQEARAGRGTLGKLVQDDSLFNELKGLAEQGRSEVKNVSQFVEDGRETMKSVRQGTDAIGRMPIIRSYVEDHTSLLVRPRDRLTQYNYNAIDIFESNSAVVSHAGMNHLNAISALLMEPAFLSAEVVVVAACDPASQRYSSATALELTKHQAEAIVQYFRQKGVHKRGWFTRRPMTALGYGLGKPPSIDEVKLTENSLQILIFTPIDSK